MMRFTKYLLLVALLGLLGCEKFLDKPIQGSQVLDNYFATPVECERALTSGLSEMFVPMKLSRVTQLKVTRGISGTWPISIYTPITNGLNTNGCIPI